MIQKLSLFLVLAFCLTAGLTAQNFYYSPEGAMTLNVSSGKILVKFTPGTSLEAQQQILQTENELVPITEDNMLPAPELTLIDVFGLSGEAAIYSLLEKLRQNERVEFANHFLVHSDGTLQGVTEKLIVGLHSESDYSRLVEAANRWGLVVTGQNQFDQKMIHLEVTKASEGNALEMANRLYETGNFAYAEPDFLRLIKRFNTNDPFVGDQWSLNNDGVNTSQYGGVAGADMKVFNAWATTTGNSSIKVAIIDEGVDLTHNDLTPNLLGGYDATGQGSGGGPSGNDAHGTACAGIVAGVGNNSTGVAGVAYSSSIIPVRIAYSNAQGNWVTSNTWIANSLNWSWQTANADILSNSWGGGSSSSAINGAIDGAVQNGRGGLGAPVLFAAGNDNGANSYPATYAPTISVIAMSMCNERKNPSSCDGETWWGSNFGNGADVAAPGVKIYATDISGAAGYTSNDYVPNFNGTSSACPNAAGVMALILSANGTLTETQARAALESTTDKVGGYTYNNGVSGQPNGSWSNDLGYGRINAQAAVLSVAPANPDDAGISAINAPSGTLCASSASPEVVLNNYGSNTLNSVTINYSLDGGSNSTYNWTGSLASSSSTTVTLPSISFAGGSHTFAANTSNPNGGSDSNSANDGSSSSFNSGSNGVTLTIVFDNYPEETSWDIRDGGGTVVASGGTYESQPDGSTLAIPVCLADACFDFTIYDSYGDGICCGFGNGSYSLTEDASGTVLASGGSFGSSETTNFCVPSGPPPVAVTANSTDASCAGASDGTATANASGGTAPYAYTWSNGGSGASISGLSAGAYTVTVTDNAGQTASASVTVSEPSAVSVSVNGTNPTSGNDNGTASASASGGTPGYNYAWSNGASGSSISGLAAGTYDVTATDNNGCQATGSITLVSGPAPLVVNASGTNVSCNGDSDGTATASASGGVAPYAYNWSNGASGANISGLSVGTYVVTVTDNSGQTETANVTITEPTALTVTATSTDDSGTSNGTATAMASGGTAAYTYNWNNGGTGSTLTSLPAGTYTVTVTDGNGCTASTSVVVNASSGCTYTTIDFNNFESGWGIWNDGGSDCRRSSSDNQYALGTYCIRLRDNTSTSVMTTDVLDLSSYDEITVDFSYYPRSMDNSNEDFWLQISTNGGSSYTTVEEWNRNDEFVNNQRYFDAVVIPGPFTNNCRFRFRCDASGNSDWIYIDEVDISGCTSSGSRDEWIDPNASPLADTEVIKKDQLIQDGVSLAKTSTLSKSISGLQLFPNPVREELTVAFNISEETDVRILVMDMNGKLIEMEERTAAIGDQQWKLNSRPLNPGFYFVHLITSNDRMTQKFVVVR